ncbi:MAG: fibronectin type III domain-containing protein, partial [Lachnospiraceae bacterium]
MRKTWKRRATAIVLGSVMTVTSIFTGGPTRSFSSLAKELESRTEIAKFDFGIDDELVADGWKSVKVNAKGMTGAVDSLYSVEKGYGFTKEVEGRVELDIQANEAYPEIPSEVYTDFAIVKGSEFLVDVPDGEYEVEMIVGSKNSNKTYVNIEGIEREVMNPGKIAFNVWTEAVTVEDGQMNFEFPNTGDGRINGIIIYNVDKSEESTEDATTEESTEADTDGNIEETPESEAYKFDFNIKGTNTAEGWNGVTVNAKGGSSETDYLYSKEQGYGFIDTGVAIDGRSESVGDNDEFNFPSDVYSDFAIASGREFVVDIENGVYAIQFIVGSVNANTTKVQVENMKEESINPGKAKYGVLTLTGVEVSDGQLNITFGGDGRINGILISTVATPENLNATVNFETPSVTLNWAQAKGLVSYNIYRKDNGTNVTKKLGNVKAFEYVDLDVELLGDYTYFVKGISADGVESAASNEVQVVMKDAGMQAPSTPQNVKVTEVTEDSTTISWDPVEGATLYRVYWSDRNRTDLEGVEGYALIDTTTETTFTYEKSTHMTRYFKVVAANAGGDSEASEVVTANINKQYNVQVEYLNRGLVAIMQEDGVFVSWRLRADEYANNTSFELYRDGKLIATLSGSENTNYVDREGTLDSVYTVKAITNGVRYTACNPATVWENQYMDVPLDIPEPYYDDKLQQTYQYNANDTSLGDADGDGEYELYVKWDPSNSQDNSKAGFTGPTIIDCYKLDGTRLFRINLGINIRSGAHYTQFQVFDFDGDGKSEMICKTADGTVDGKGTVIGDSKADYRNDSGYVLDGPEYLTLFDGFTGEALDTIDYNPARGNVGDWGDTYGNRVDRFLAGVAYLDGEHPSAIFSRGYYTRVVVCAYDVVDKKLTERWVIDSNDEESKYLYNQGAHSLTTSDVDNDGCQEVIFGSATIDNDGTLLYSLSEAGEGYGGHGDAERVGDFN